MNGIYFRLGFVN